MTRRLASNALGLQSRDSGWFGEGCDELHSPSTWTTIFLVRGLMSNSTNTNCCHSPSTRSPFTSGTERPGLTRGPHVRMAVPVTLPPLVLVPDALLRSNPLEHFREVLDKS